MEDSIAHPSFRARAIDMPAWKGVISVISAVLIGLLFIVSGVYKITDPLTWAAGLIQFKVPAALSIPATLLLGTGETFAGVLLMVPRFRRWGAWLSSLLLVVFMGYMAINYNALHGADCSCFPLIKRVVGPGFFVGDTVMLLMAILAGVWARPSESLRSAVIILGAVAVFAGVCFGVVNARQTGLQAPDSITVDGQPYSLQHGKIFLYFFDPECSHCFAAAKNMSTFTWKGAKVIAIPTAQPRFAQGFLTDTNLKAGVSNDLEFLKKTFHFIAGPYGVALENGRQKEAYINFDEKEPKEGLKKLGFIE
ncbi:MAG: DoxX family protein [Bryobacteraceae bacterium]